MKRLSNAVLLVLFACASAAAAPLNVVNVGAPAVNCVFNKSCRVTVSDTTANIPLAGGGTGFLQSRTFTGMSPAPAAGLYGYEYRIDLRNAVAITGASCVNSLTVEIGPVRSLDYNGDGTATDQIYVVNSGALGSIGIASAVQTGRNVTFTFSSPVCPGGSPGRGDSTFFFGYASTEPPRSVTANYFENGSNHNIEARAPRVARRRP
jgi:hypothetical protein